MIIYAYDRTFDGLLTTVFEAYSRKLFPQILVEPEEVLPLFYDGFYKVITDADKASRVWKGLQKKLSFSALAMLTTCWLSEIKGIDVVMFRYICKAIDAPTSIELNFADTDVLELSKVWKKVNSEKVRIIQFSRFQKSIDGTFFAPFEPIYNALPLTIAHFKDRFADQKWIIYDLKREYGYYYNLQSVEEVTFEHPEGHLLSGMLDESLMAEDEKLFQQLWKTYFKAIAIKERLNPRLHKQHIPVRYWKYLTEKQG